MNLELYDECFIYKLKILDSDGSHLYMHLFTISVLILFLFWQAGSPEDTSCVCFNFWIYFLNNLVWAAPLCKLMKPRRLCLSH